MVPEEPCYGEDCLTAHPSSEARHPDQCSPPPSDPMSYLLRVNIQTAESGAWEQNFSHFYVLALICSGSGLCTSLAA